jgi:hypothetical protein
LDKAVREFVLKFVRHWRSVFFWSLFAIGLLLQAFGPHLKIKNNKFVMPPSLVLSGKQIRPDAIVARERIMQSLSAVLTVGGGLGLAFCYRKALFGRRSAPRDLAGGSDQNRPAIESWGNKRERERRSPFSSSSHSFELLQKGDNKWQHAALFVPESFFWQQP